jgi:AICAR transformylase/IMP cyclohydrolase PurH
MLVEEYNKMNNNSRWIDEKTIKKLQKEIENKRKKLIQFVKDNGIYENFGQKEVMQLKDKYSDYINYMDMNQKQALIHEFDQWCMSYCG